MESGLSFAGLLLMENKLKANTPLNIAALHAASVRCNMVRATKAAGMPFTRPSFCERMRDAAAVGAATALGSHWVRSLRWRHGPPAAALPTGSRIARQYARVPTSTRAEARRQVTGDHVLTALAVARACGLVREDEDIIVGDVFDAPLPSSAVAATAAVAVTAAAAADVSWTNFGAASTKGAPIDLTALSCGKVPQVRRAPGPAGGSCGRPGAQGAL